MMFNVMTYHTKCLQFVALQLRSSMAKDRNTGVDYQIGLQILNMSRTGLTTYKRMCHLPLNRYGKAALYSHQ